MNPTFRNLWGTLMGKPIGFKIGNNTLYRFNLKLEDGPVIHCKCLRSGPSKMDRLLPNAPMSNASGAIECEGDKLIFNIWHYEIDEIARWIDDEKEER